MILILKSAYNIFVMTLSIAAFSVVSTFVNSTKGLTLPSAPKALANVEEIFIPPMINLQVFVLIFDILVALYYIYNWNVWDSIKNKFVYF